MLLFCLIACSDLGPISVIFRLFRYYISVFFKGFAFVVKVSRTYVFIYCRISSLGVSRVCVFVCFWKKFLLKFSVSFPVQN